MTCEANLDAPITLWNPYTLVGVIWLYMMGKHINNDLHHLVIQAAVVCSKNTFISILLPNNPPDLKMSSKQDAERSKESV